MSEIREIKGKDSSQYDQLLDKMFNNVESPKSLIVDLPSRSKFYNSVEEVVVSP